MTEYSIPNTGEGYQIRPFYLCIDVSGSMGADKTGKPPWPIDVVNQELEALLRTFHKDIELSEVVKLALISFSDKASVEHSLSKPDKIMSFPKLGAHGNTSYLKPLQLLREVIDQDFRQRKPNKWYRPVVLFITDGYPNQETAPEWGSARDRLLDPKWLPYPIFVVFGFGKANAEVIKALASGQKYTGTALMAEDSETPVNQITRIMTTLQQSIIKSAEEPSQVAIETEGLLVLSTAKQDDLDPAPIPSE